MPPQEYSRRVSHLIIPITHRLACVRNISRGFAFCFRAEIYIIRALSDPDARILIFIKPQFFFFFLRFHSGFRYYHHAQEFRIPGERSLPYYSFYYFLITAAAVCIPLVKHRYSPSSRKVTTPTVYSLPRRTVQRAPSQSQRRRACLVLTDRVIHR